MPNEYPDFIEKTGYGKLLGLAGVNCRHTFSTYYPDVQTSDTDYVDPDANKKYYNLTQTQRLKERNIRELKRRIAGIEASGISDEETVKKLYSLKGKLIDKNNEYKEFCKEHKLSTANWRKQI